jgi:hypothetical protein
MFQEGRIVIDNSFQRKYVWSRKNQISLIESILLGYPIPEFIFLQKMSSSRTSLVVIDGQQRIGAIVDFINGEFELSRKHLIDNDLSHSVGDMKYENLNHEQRMAFLDYPLSFRIIGSDLNENEIRAIFTRLNSNSLPLNPQELRNATYDGEFLKLAEEIADFDFWNKYQLFSNQERRRMQDIQFVSSILLFFRMGISGETNQEVYNKVYDMYNEVYEEKTSDYQLFKKLLNQIEPILSIDRNRKFLKRKTHLYALLLVVYKIQKRDFRLNEKHLESFNKFVLDYNLPNEDININMVTQRLIDIDEYKKLSSSNTQQKLNRMKRVKLLEGIVENKY